MIFQTLLQYRLKNANPQGVLTEQLFSGTENLTHGQEAELFAKGLQAEVRLMPSPKGHSTEWILVKEAKVDWFVLRPVVTA